MEETSKQATTQYDKIFFPFLKLDMVLLGIQLQESSPTFDKVSELSRIIVIKIERPQILHESDIFATVTILGSLRSLFSPSVKCNDHLTRKVGGSRPCYS